MWKMKQAPAFWLGCGRGGSFVTTVGFLPPLMPRFQQKKEPAATGHRLKVKYIKRGS